MPFVIRLCPASFERQVSVERVQGMDVDAVERSIRVTCDEMSNPQMWCHLACMQVEESVFTFHLVWAPRHTLLTLVEHVPTDTVYLSFDKSRPLKCMDVAELSYQPPASVPKYDVQWLRNTLSGSVGISGKK